MSSFEIALENELSSVAGLNNLVFPINATEGQVAPYLVYVSSDGLPEKALEGYLGLIEVDFELNVFHNSYANLKTLIPLVNAKVISFQSRAIGANGPYIQNVTLHPSIELWEDALKMWRANIQVKINF